MILESIVVFPFSNTKCLMMVLLVLPWCLFGRRFHHIRRYSMVNQNEDTDALLDDDEDEPPLDLRSDARDSVRSRDENMLDLGTGNGFILIDLYR